MTIKQTNAKMFIFDQTLKQIEKKLERNVEKLFIAIQRCGGPMGV